MASSVRNCMPLGAMPTAPRPCVTRPSAQAPALAGGVEGGWAVLGSPPPGLRPAPGAGFATPTRQAPPAPDRREAGAPGAR
eukprot:9038839-Alexandrium_andersonii.AAC.1